jgi:hypothetical protein
MGDFFVVHSSDQQRDDLRGVLAADVEYRQARAFRRFFLTRLALIIAGAWVLSWPVHLFPHTLVWALLATAALVIGLTSPPRTQPTSSDRRLKPPR